MKQLKNLYTPKKIHFFSMLLYISQRKKMASGKWNWHSLATWCPVKALISVIVNEAASSGLYAAAPAPAAQSNTND